MTLELLFERGINDGPGMHLILAAEHNFGTVPRNPTRHKKGPGKMAEIVILCSKHSAQVIKNRVENFFFYLYILCEFCIMHFNVFLWKTRQKKFSVQNAFLKMLF